jgi:ankyrin repeat protein
MKFEDVVQFSYERLRICDVDRYLDAGYDINFQDPRPGPGYPQKGWTLLHFAASNGHIEVIRHLANRGANLNVTDAEGWTALHLAVDFDDVVATQDGHLPSEMPVTETLLRLGADDSIANKQGQTARDYTVPEVYDRVKQRVRVG